MQCPVDGSPLDLGAGGGVEIDFCPTCRGVWLDREELGKLLEWSHDRALREHVHPDSHRERSPILTG